VSITSKQQEKVHLCKKCKELICDECKKEIGENKKGGEKTWQGGGGFKYYYLAPSILNQDTYGNWVINKKYNPAMLAAAVAKHEGFTFSPDTEHYWKQGRSTEQDFIFTTTEFVTQEHVDKIHSEMAADESLLICCKSFNASSTRHPNITIKKIPNMLLGRCEFGKEDYSLNIVNMPMTEDVPEVDAASEPDKGEKKPKKQGRKKKTDDRLMPLFDGGNDE
jgi:adenine-specific DNA-methyltransferase